jgi:preprotein translocase subunit SecF
MFDIVGKRYWFFALSLLVIIPGLISIGIRWTQTGSPLPLAIDFTGGSILELQFKDVGTPIQPGDVTAILTQNGFDDSLVQTSSANAQTSIPDTILIRTKEMQPADKTRIEDALKSRYGAFIELNFQSVGPAIGAEVARAAAIAVAMAALGMLLYIWFAFRQVPNAFRYGTAAVLAMLHDVLVVLGLESILGYVFGWQVDSLFLTALLTVIGFSVHDTIVVFDRIRENMIRHRGEDFELIVNHSIIQTLDRSINTQLTVMFTLLAMVLFGGVTIRHFVTILLLGVFSGSYSSIFNAASILVVWENREWRTWFRRQAPATV